ncbi:Sulfotransferase [Hyella patelloides LEGE 07179]|uniref:Sulfotransferase n=1 Tax=Hyella patelloides LEGE 07179 TaxID=945734 RepID=A0A563VYV6_9CYAN|nr:sulfotransferase [Hyella patelloides]VEP16606.1 Sulfotransferase [Hyella patelloides LEGE 07179]
MVMPNFLILGAAKTGTTSIYRYMKQHPEIYMSPAKEPRFFVFENETLDFNGVGDEIETAKTSLQEYQQLFAGVEAEKAIGEATTMYLWSAKAPQRIKHYIPDVRMIAILRNPVDRAYSNYLHLKQAKREPLDSFSAAIQQESQRIKNHWWPFWYYKDQGFYYRQLQRYYSLFDSNQLKIYLYEDLKTEPLKLLQDIFSFLEVDDRFMPNISEVVRKSHSVPKNQALQSLVSQPNPFKSFLKPLLPQNLRQQIIKKINKKNLVKPQVSSKFRQQLIAEYREDVLQLQELIDRDLSPWLKV